MRFLGSEAIHRNCGGNKLKTFARTLANCTGILLAVIAPHLAHAIEGHGMVEAVRLGVDPAVVLNGKAYRVTERTVLEGRQGERLALGQLPSVEAGGTVDETSAWFDWQGDPRDRILNELRIRDID